MSLKAKAISAFTSTLFCQTSSNVYWSVIQRQISRQLPWMSMLDVHSTLSLSMVLLISLSTCSLWELQSIQAKMNTQSSLRIMVEWTMPTHLWQVQIIISTVQMKHLRVHLIDLHNFSLVRYWVNLRLKEKWKQLILSITSLSKMMLGISIHFNSMKLTQRALFIGSLAVILSLFNKRAFGSLYSLSTNAGIQQISWSFVLQADMILIN